MAASCRREPLLGEVKELEPLPSNVKEHVGAKLTTRCPSTTSIAGEVQELEPLPSSVMELVGAKLTTRCPSIAAVACTSIRAKHWRHGITVSVVPANKTPRPISMSISAAGVFWGSVVVATFVLWGWLVWRWWPTSWSTPKLVEHSLTFSLHIVFMDLVPNYLTGLCLHRIPFLERWEHRWEHCATKSGSLASIFMVTTLYAWYTLLFMVAWGLGVACTSPAHDASCFNWESAMWLASFSYALVGLALRLVFWAMRHAPSMYARYPVLLKMSRFYWAHFHFLEWRGGVVFGACTPFYDVVFGTCPFDIKWSCPIPFVDFLVCEQAVFRTVRHPRKLKWTALQWAWHVGWLALIAGLVAALVWLQAAGYFATNGNQFL